MAEQANPRSGSPGPGPSGAVPVGDDGLALPPTLAARRPSVSGVIDEHVLALLRLWIEMAPEDFEDAETRDEVTGILDRLRKALMAPETTRRAAAAVYDQVRLAASMDLAVHHAADGRAVLSLAGIGTTD